MADAWRVASRSGSLPGGSSTTNDAVPGKVLFCQFGAVPAIHGSRRKGNPAMRAYRRATGTLGPQARTSGSAC
jgi:hypothetical protein